MMRKVNLQSVTNPVHPLIALPDRAKKNARAVDLRLHRQGYQVSWRNDRIARGDVAASCRQEDQALSRDCADEECEPCGHEHG
jgi:hypothetical protein